MTSLSSACTNRRGDRDQIAALENAWQHEKKRVTEKD
jgi:hypothetical protein